MNQTNDTNKRIAEICGTPLSEPCWRYSYWPNGQKKEGSVSAGGFHTEAAARKDIAHLKDRFGFECSEPVSYESPLEPPNYTESLDAIREAVLAQDERFQNLFTSELDEMERINRTAVWKLTAADWCAAFLAVVEGRGE